MSDQKKPDDADVIIKIDAAAFGRALAFAAKEDIRFYLNGVHIVAGPLVRIEGTDGMRLYVEDVPTAKARRSAILRLSPMGRQLLRPFRNVVYRADGSLKIETCDGVPLYVEPQNAEIVGAKFPDIRVVLGDPSKWAPGVPQIFNADLLRSLVTSPGEVGFFHRPSQGVHSPLLVVYGNHKEPGRGNAIGMLMPLNRASLSRPLAQLMPISLIPEPETAQEPVARRATKSEQSPPAAPRRAKKAKAA